MFNEAGSSGTGSIPMQQVRAHSTSPAGEKAKPETPPSSSLPAADAANGHVHAHEHTNGVANGHEHLHQHHEHEHEHGLFGHSHSHGEEDGHGLIDALQSGSDKGARITVIGLLSNIVLTGAKGAAGWFMNSAALLAEAGHSFSDLLGDFVVLFSWRLSRRPPSKRYPFGLAKFETFGTTVVALLLISGGLGIGFHALSLLLTALSETAQTMAPGPLHTAIQNVTEVVNHLPAVAHVHSHSHAVPALDPNAAWFAAVSVLAKEWLFRITRRVAKEENSPVLMANAFHHRSDAYSSAVALVAIMGSTFFPALPLDPIGGVVVSIVIIQQGVSIFAGAFREITDASVSLPTLRTLEKSLDPLTVPLSSSPLASSLLAIDALRARRAGSSLFVDLTAHVRPGSDVAALLRIEEAVAGALKGARKDVKDVVVRFREADESEPRPRIPPTQSDGSQ